MESFICATTPRVARAFRARRALLFCLALVLTASPWRPVAAYAAAHAEHVPAADAELGSAADAELVPAAEPVSAADLVLTSASSFMVAAGAAVDEETHLSPAAAVALSLGIVGAVSLLDEPLYNAVRGAATPARKEFFATVTHLGDGLTAVALTAALWPRDRDTAMLMGHAGLRAGLATVALKSVISRARPYEDAAQCAEYRVGLGSCVSMPSGHTATAFSMARVLAHRYPEQSWIWYGLAALAGWSRVETDNHWPSDVAAGAILGYWAADSVIKQSGD